MDNSKALAIINNNAGALVFARREEVEMVSPQFEPIVTVLELAPSDFTDVGMGNMYPGKSATNRISDAAGVSFLYNVGGTREVGSWSGVKAVKQTGGFWQAVGEFKIIGFAQGQRLKPDGTPRLSSIREYEFNVVDRANEDFLKDFSKGPDAKYTSEVAALKHLLELKKFTTQRASTGAELGVVRELVGMPTAFKKDQIGKPMVFSQIVENNRFKVEIAREIMQTPDGRAAVVNALFGVSKALYGPQQGAPALTAGMDARATVGDADIRPADDQETRTVSETPASLAAEAIDDDSDGFGDTAPTATVDPRKDAILALEEYLASGVLNEKSAAYVRGLINNKDTPTAMLVEYVGKCRGKAEKATE